ncbi:DNA-binding protein HU [bioreactor metagenome]|uniref:DNA-binding protein HU n=1 Tax=bioreactor metagenome TaxID=1076179 RepID=A0A645CLY4_9ZZZZ
MNKNELIDAIAQEADVTKAAAGRVLDALTSTVVKAVASGDSVTLVGFGSFETVSTKARQGRNPATGDVLTIDATVRPKFSPGSNFKALVKETLEK